MSILQYNGSALIGMAGKNCVALASDRRFGAQQQLISTKMQRIFKINNRTLMGLSGLATDVATVSEEIKMKTELFALREDREMKPSTFDAFVSSMLYARRFGPYFVEPLIVGLEGPDNKPFLSGQDLLGCAVFTNDYVVAGTADASLYGTCEAFYKPDLNPDELFEVISQCIANATDRDCLSGTEYIVYILTPNELIIKEVIGRPD